MKTSRRIFDLGGDWTLNYAEEGTAQQNAPIKAVVPGNYELDLQRAGIIGDPFVAKNCMGLRKYEFHQFIYERSFPTPDLKNPDLVFEGLDCFADIWLNGVKIASTDNALVEHRFPIATFLKPKGKENQIRVCIKSPMYAIKDCKMEPWMHGAEYNIEMLRMRKPAHCFGWDIMPRILSGGIYRPVYLEERADNEISDIYIASTTCSTAQASMQCYFSIRTIVPRLEDLSIRLTGQCGDSKFHAEHAITNFWGLFYFSIDTPKLWWPRGYGDANIYNVKAELLHDATVIASRELTLGIRDIRLDMTEINTVEHPGRFQFFVNDVPVFVKGSNWVPADALHSRDAARIPKMLALFSDMGCNMLRCWGGNLYEADEFYDICDKEGIMVWQDFSMACGAYPLDEEFLGIMRKEAEQVVIQRRQHPSIVLWAGDNENDSCLYAWLGKLRNPGKNRITREILPQVLDRLDGYRPYVPSSPFIAPAIADAGLPSSFAPEQHLWGPRDYYKSNFYLHNNACFASEMGYHGCPSPSSIRKFVSPEKVWPWKDNDEWLLHSTDPVPGKSHIEYRIELMAKQILEVFGFIPDNLDDFALASQFVQAEAKKFFVEIFRQRKPKTGGLIWWNMIDGWPQISDAIVDYYFKKKLAYPILKRSHRQLCLIMAEPSAWGNELLVCNDSNREFNGHYRLLQGESQNCIQEGDFHSPANTNVSLGLIRVPQSLNDLFIMEWEADGERHANHYISGRPAFDFAKVKRWLEIIKNAELPFDWEL